MTFSIELSISPELIGLVKAALMAVDPVLAVNTCTLIMTCIGVYIAFLAYKRGR